MGFVQCMFPLVSDLVDNKLVRKFLVVLVVNCDVFNYKEIMKLHLQQQLSNANCLRLLPIDYCYFVIGSAHMQKPN